MDDKFKNSEDALRNAANLYAEEHGKSLLAEFEDMRAHGVSYMTPRADKVAQDLIKTNQKSKINKFVKIFAPIAACLVIVFAVVQVTNLGGQDAGPQGDTPAASPSESTEIYWDEIQPISFTLPTGFTVAESKLDNGKTIHRLESTNEEHPDDVVLTISEPEGAESFIGSETINIDGNNVHTKVDDGFMMLLFEKDGKLYTVSTESDMDSLANFYRNIEA